MHGIRLSTGLDGRCCSRARVLAIQGLLFAALTLCMALGPHTAHAEPPRELQYDLRIDIPLTAFSSVLWATSPLFQGALTPSRCHWCRDNALDREARDLLRLGGHAPIDRASSAVAFGVVPGVALASLAALAARSGRAKAALYDAWFMLEAVSTSVVANTIVKLAVARERPYAHARDFGGHIRGGYERRSFYSQHTDIAFAIASAAGSLATLHGYRLHWVVWLAGLSAASFVAYARVAADEHYLSDVLVGSVFGTLFGAGLPFLLHRSRTSARVPSVSVTRGGLFFAWRR